MQRYKWGFLKSRDFILSKKPNVKINKEFSAQLSELEQVLLNALSSSISIPNIVSSRLSSWDSSYLQDIKSIEDGDILEEEVLLVLLIYYTIDILT